MIPVKLRGPQRCQVFLNVFKILSFFSCTHSLSVFLNLLKSAILGFFASFLPALYNMWPNIVPHVLLFVTSLVLLQKTFFLIQRKKTSLQEHLTSGSMYHICQFCYFFTKRAHFLKKVK